jgi:hypothetical protein
MHFKKLGFRLGSDLIILSRAKKKMPPKSPKKAATKAPYPALREVREFTYIHIPKAFFGYKKNVFRIFLSVGRIFAALLPARDHDKSPGFSPRGLVLPCTPHG